MNTAIAILKSGRSFDEASRITGIPVNEIMAEWSRLNQEWQCRQESDQENNHRAIWNKWSRLMKRDHAQAYIFALALLLYCSPLPLIFGDDHQRYVLSVYVALQFLFVIACNKLVRESWIIFVILIEAICMTWNAILFFNWDKAGSVFYHVYSHFMFLAFVLEILIINLSMRGGEDERRNAGTNPKRPNFTLFCRLNSRNRQAGGQAVAK